MYDNSGTCAAARLDDAREHELLLARGRQIGVAGHMKRRLRVLDRTFLPRRTWGTAARSSQAFSKVMLTGAIR